MEPSMDSAFLFLAQAFLMPFSLVFNKVSSWFYSQPEDSGHLVIVGLKNSGKKSLARVLQERESLFWMTCAEGADDVPEFQEVTADTYPVLARIWDTEDMLPFVYRQQLLENAIGVLAVVDPDDDIVLVQSELEQVLYRTKNLPICVVLSKFDQREENFSPQKIVEVLKLEANTNVVIHDVSSLVGVVVSSCKGLNCTVCEVGLCAFNYLMELIQNDVIESEMFLNMFHFKF